MYLARKTGIKGTGDRHAEEGRHSADLHVSKTAGRQVPSFRANEVCGCTDTLWNTGAAQAWSCAVLECKPHGPKKKHQQNASTHLADRFWRFSLSITLGRRSSLRALLMTSSFFAFGRGGRRGGAAFGKSDRVVLAKSNQNYGKEWSRTVWTGSVQPGQKTAAFSRWGGAQTTL